MVKKRIDDLSPHSGRVLLSGEQIGTDLTFAFPASAPANTQVAMVVVMPTEEVGHNDPLQAYKIVVANPSAVTDLTLKLFTVEKNMGGADRDCFFDSFDIPKAQTVTGTMVAAHEFMTGGIFCGGDLKLVLSNNSVLGAGDGFAATLRIREV